MAKFLTTVFMVLLAVVLVPSVTVRAGQPPAKDSGDTIELRAADNGKAALIMADVYEKGVKPADWVATNTANANK